jgi:hypothetical protein
MRAELAENISERSDVAKENAPADYTVEHAIRRPAHRPQTRNIARPKSHQEQRHLQNNECLANLHLAMPFREIIHER